MLILVCSIFISAISCAKAPCKKKGISFDKGLMKEKIPAIKKVVRKISSEDKPPSNLDENAQSYLCEKFEETTDDSVKRFFDAIYKRLKLNLSDVVKWTKCDNYSYHEYTTNMITYSFIGPNTDTHIAEMIVKILKKEDPELLEYLVNDFREEYPIKYSSELLTVKKMTIAEILCEKAYWSLRTSGTRSREAPGTRKLAEGRIRDLRDYGYKGPGCDWNNIPYLKNKYRK